MNLSDDQDRPRKAGVMTGVKIGGICIAWAILSFGLERWAGTPKMPALQYLAVTIPACLAGMWLESVLRATR